MQQSLCLCFHLGVLSLCCQPPRLEHLALCSSQADGLTPGPSCCPFISHLAAYWESTYSHGEIPWKYNFVTQEISKQLQCAKHCDACEEYKHQVSVRHRLYSPALRWTQPKVMVKSILYDLLPTPPRGQASLF